MAHYTNKLENEIRHGRFLAENRPDIVWGWQSPAGKNRAKRRAGMIVSQSSIGPGKRVLEIGCGTGIFTQYFMETGARVIAMDISQDLLSIAQKRMAQHDNVEFLRQRFEDCKVNGTFDAIIGSSVLHHLEILPALRKINQLLKPGGVMTFAEPNFMNPQVFVTKTVPCIKQLMGESPDETAFWPWQIKKLLEKHSMIDIRVVPFDWLHPAVPESLIPRVVRLGACIEKIPVVRYFSGSLCIAGRRPG